jgi:hypothetical protein
MAENESSPRWTVAECILKLRVSQIPSPRFAYLLPTISSRSAYDHSHSDYWANPCSQEGSELLRVV